MSIQDLVRTYNELFNSTRPREYDGSHIVLGGMNPDITLREHQRGAIAHVLSSICSCKMRSCRSADMGIFSNWLWPMITAS